MILKNQRADVIFNGTKILFLENINKEKQGQSTMPLQ
jgi:hypothetical protein